MKKLKKCMIFCNIVIIMILIFLCVRYFYLSSKYNELEKLNVEYTRLITNIENYTKIKNEYFVLKDEEKSTQTKIAELNTKKERLKNEINDYNLKIDKLNKALGYSK